MNQGNNLSCGNRPFKLRKVKTVEQVHRFTLSKNQIQSNLCCSLPCWNQKLNWEMNLICTTMNPKHVNKAKELHMYNTDTTLQFSSLSTCCLEQYGIHLKSCYHPFLCYLVHLIHRTWESGSNNQYGCLGQW